jgi:hypothetical protein
MLLRSGHHPKDKQWIGLPFPEVSWSATTVSDVNLSLQEGRVRDKIVEQKLAISASSSSNPVSRLESVRLRIRQKEAMMLKNGVVLENHIAASSSSRSTCLGARVSSSSRFEALRQRVREKEIHAKGIQHVDG